MLVTKEVIMKWSPRNKTYYLSKEYVFSEYGNEFIIKVEDLTERNSSIVEYMCDFCFSIYSTTYNNTLRNLRLNGKHKCKKCASRESASIRKVDPEIIIDTFKKYNLTLLDDLEKIYKNDRTKLKYRCNIHNNIVQPISYNKLKLSKFPCRLCNNENISKRQRGYKSHSWKGGISSIHGYLRRELKTQGWFYKSLKANNSKCIISSKRAECVHHVYSFSKILNETIKEFNLEIKDKISNYTNEELEIFKLRFFEVHNRYPLGAPLTKKIHNKYHSIYGNDNTPEQFEEFKLQYDFGV